MVNKKRLKPQPKVQAGVNFGALATVGVGVFAVAFPELYTRFPPMLEGAVVGFVVSFAAWLKADV